MKFTLEVGEIEKHRLEYNFNQLLGSLLIKVHDTGTGIAPEDLPRVFERFFRANEARPETGETGLGLAIAGSIVEAQGGTISVESTSGAGTTFSLSFPIQ